MIAAQPTAATTLLLVGAIALGAGAYARYSSENTAMDDPEYLRNDLSTVDNSISHPDDGEKAVYKSTYDPTRGERAGEEIAENTATSTNMATNRSSAYQVDDDL